MDRFEKVRRLATEILPEAIEFAQRLVRCPSLGGDEKKRCRHLSRRNEKNWL